MYHWHFDDPIVTELCISLTHTKYLAQRSKNIWRKHALWYVLVIFWNKNFVISSSSMKGFRNSSGTTEGTLELSELLLLCKLQLRQPRSNMLYKKTFVGATPLFLNRSIIMHHGQRRFRFTEKQADLPLPLKRWFKVYVEGKHWLLLWSTLAIPDTCWMN